LNRQWSFWENYETKTRQEKDYTKLLKEIYSFKDLISFWQFWNKYPGSDTKNIFYNGDCIKYFFKEFLYVWSNYYIKHDINCFIIKLITIYGYGTIDNKSVIESLSDLLKYYDDLKDLKIEKEDIFKTHFESEEKDKNLYNKELAQTIEKFAYSGYRFNNDDLFKLIIHFFCISIN